MVAEEPQQPDIIRPEAGPRCRHCECPDLWVSRTRRVGEQIIRWRVCRACSKTTITTEAARR